MAINNLCSFKYVTKKAIKRGLSECNKIKDDPLFKSGLQLILSWKF